jgi:hypothetical protein
MHLNCKMYYFLTEGNAMSAQEIWLQVLSHVHVHSASYF